jgi:probable rRNA maturation factor
MTPTVLVDRELGARVDPATRRDLARRVRRAARRLGLTPGELDGLAIRIVADATIAELHARFLGEPRRTDVLSFAAAQGSEAFARVHPAQEAFGDVVLCWDAVCRQAISSCETARRDEAVSLCVHAVVHLLGCDHGTRVEARRMLRLERRGLRAAGLCEPSRSYGG